MTSYFSFENLSKNEQGEELVSPDLGSEKLKGAGMMQTWDISILNVKGKTQIYIDHDMRDQEINEVVLL